MKKTIFLSILISFLSCKKAEDKPVEDNVQQNISKEKYVLQEEEEKITMAQKLAVLDTENESLIDVNDRRVKDIQLHLNSLSNTFNQSEDKIANTIFIVHKKFEEEGLKYSIIELLRIADKEPEIYKESGISFEEFMALLFTLTDK